MGAPAWHWLRVAWLTAGSNPDSNGIISAAVAVKEGPGGHQRVLLTGGDRRGDQHSGVMSLVLQAAQHGISLRGATCYLWPGLGPFHEFELLLDCGVRELRIPRFPVPKRLEDDDHQCRWRASCLGVRIHESEDPRCLFDPLRAVLLPEGNDLPPLAKVDAP